MKRYRGAMAPEVAAVTLLLLLAFPPAAAQTAAAAAVSKLWGKAGELYSPKKLFDFSFAGYHQGNLPLPEPPATRSVLDAEFTAGAKSTTETFKRALAWAHAQPVTPGSYIVLTVPPGQYTLKERLYIERPWLVLRGAGSAQTTLFFPKNLMELYGPSPEDSKGFYVNEGGFITMRGKSRQGTKLASVTGAAKKGDNKLTVSSTESLRVGDYITLWWKDIGGKFNSHMYDNKIKAPAKYNDTMRVCYTSKITAINGKVITLERYLPYDIRSGLNSVNVHAMPDSVQESGVEGLTFQFAWSLYPGHHLENGYNALQLYNVTDCWVRDIRTIDADSSVLIKGCAQVTVKDISIESTKTRANNIPNIYKERADCDGHWGVQAAHTFDLLVDGFNTSCQVLHDVGADASAKWCVFSKGRMKDGNTDLHRALSGPSLYTDIDVGLGTDGLISGGPATSGANAIAGTTWWNIRSKMPMKPPHANDMKGPCTFGPVINLVNVHLIPDPAKICKTWFVERSVAAPPNLWEAQRARRQAPKWR